VGATCIQTVKKDQRGIYSMKKVIFTLGGLCAAAAGFFVWNALRTESLTNAKPVPVDQLAHRLEEAWADHHTLA
jgi:hypothetical protein